MVAEVSESWLVLSGALTAEPQAETETEIATMTAAKAKAGFEPILRGHEYFM
jgi:hypothetical protein